MVAAEMVWDRTRVRMGHRDDLGVCMPIYEPLRLRYYAIEYHKSTAVKVQGALYRIALPGNEFGNQDGWGLPFSLDGATGRLLFEGNDFSASHPDDAWVIVLPMNGTNPIGRVEIVRSTLVEWERDYQVVETETTTLPRR